MAGKRWLIISVLLLGMVSTATGRIVYVDADANGVNDGSSWTDAYNYLQDALTVAQYDDEIRVAQGIYKPDEDSAHPDGTGYRTATFQLRNGVAIYGGYAGFGELDPNARDIDIYETILSGDLAGNDVNVNDPADLLDEPTRAENSYHVVTGSWTDETAVLDGFTITGGNANGSNENRYGGGMYNDSGSPTVANCTFSENSAHYGGGMYNFGSSPTLINCTFTGNGSGPPPPPRMFVDAGATGANDGSSWADAFNDLQDGLGVALNGDEIRVAQGIYKPDEDSAHPDGTGYRTATFQLRNGVAVKGGYAGLGTPDPNARDINAYETILSGDLNGDDGPDFANNGENSYHVVRSHFSLRTAVLDGFTITAGNADGSYPNNYGGGMKNQADPTIVNCTIIGNHADSCGGGSSSTDCGGGGKFIGCTIRDNTAGLHGGGVSAVFYDSPEFFNCVIINNKAGEHGGGIYSGYSRVEISNCTFSGNSAETGKGGGIYQMGNEVKIDNSILWGDTAATGGPEIAMIGQAQHTPTKVEVSYSDIQGGQGMVYQEGDYGTLAWGEGNIDADPCFVEPGYWDANEVWVDGDYHLLPDSPCINAGDPNYAAGPNETDLDGKPRIIGGRIDMGAYEYPNTTPVACIVDGNQVVEAEAPWGARVTLDGSCSSDSDSAPGTNDDIVCFDWYKVDSCDPNFEDFLASGEIIDCNLPLGEHIIVLEVIDKAGAFDTNEVTIIVQDTTPPDFTLFVTPTTLWPANHKMVLITPSWTVSDICDDSPVVSLVSITMNEADEAKGDGHTTLNIQIGDDGSIYLRAERSGTGSGRIYTITYQAVDDSGNVAVARATVTVPHDQR